MLSHWHHAVAALHTTWYAGREDVQGPACRVSPQTLLRRKSCSAVDCQLPVSGVPALSMLLAFGVQSALHQTALADGVGSFSHVGGWFTSAKIAPGAASISERPHEKKAGSRYLLSQDLSYAGGHI